MMPLHEDEKHMGTLQDRSSPAEDEEATSLALLRVAAFDNEQQRPTPTGA